MSSLEQAIAKGIEICEYPVPTSQNDNGGDTVSAANATPQDGVGEASLPKVDVAARALVADGTQGNDATDDSNPTPDTAAGEPTELDSLIRRFVQSALADTSQGDAALTPATPPANAAEAYTQNKHTWTGFLLYVVHALMWLSNVGVLLSDSQFNAGLIVDKLPFTDVSEHSLNIINWVFKVCWFLLCLVHFISNYSCLLPPKRGYYQLLCGLTPIITFIALLSTSVINQINLSYLSFFMTADVDLMYCIIDVGVIEAGSRLLAGWLPTKVGLLLCALLVGAIVRMGGGVPAGAA